MLFSFFSNFLLLGASERSGFPYPANRLGNCDETGNVSIWIENDLKFGVGQDTLPFRLNFSSRQQHSHDSPMGLGWWIPLLESSVVAVSDDRVRLTSLGGSSVYLNRLDSDGQFMSSNATWTGQLESGGEFTASRQDGWSFSFTDGRLSTAVTPSGSLLRWNRRADGKVFEISDSRKETNLFSAKYDENGLLREVEISNTKVKFRYQDVPLLGNFPGGGVGIIGLESSLAEILVDETLAATIEYGLNDRSKYYFELKGQQGSDRITWDPGTGLITSDSLSSYNYSDRDGVKQISRNFDSGRVDEYVWDRNRFQQRIKINGSSETNQLSGSRGPNFMKLVKRKLVTEGQPPVEFQFQYDENGQILRKTEIGGGVSPRI